MNVIRQGDFNVIQVGCVIQWNFIFAFLQFNFRKYVRKSFILLVDVFEDI